MATAAGIIILAGSISLANEALTAPYEKGATDVAKYINWRIVPATAIAAVLFAGLESANAALAKGLASVALVTSLIHPIGNGPSPLVHLSQLVEGNSPSGPTPSKSTGGVSKTTVTFA